MTKSEGVLHKLAIGVAGVFALLSVAITIYHSAKHLRYYTRPLVQRLYLRILVMVPVYALDSWFGLMSLEYSMYYDIVRDSYEAYTLYTFLCLLKAYIGDEDKLLDAISLQPPLKHAPPLNLCLKPVKMNKRFLDMSKAAVCQFLVLKPTLSVLSLFLDWGGVYREGEFSFQSGYVYITFLTNLSVTVALYALLLFYLGTRELLAKYNPGIKFLCVKAVVFFTFWQGLAIAVLTRVDFIHETAQFTAENVATGVQDFLICIEMFFAALLHQYAFSYRDFKMDDQVKAPFFETVGDAFSVKEVLDDIDLTYRTLIPKPRGSAKTWIGMGSGHVPGEKLGKVSPRDEDFDVEGALTDGPSSEALLPEVPPTAASRTGVYTTGGNLRGERLSDAVSGVGLAVGASVNTTDEQFRSRPNGLISVDGASRDHYHPPRSESENFFE